MKFFRNISFFVLVMILFSVYGLAYAEDTQSKPSVVYVSLNGNDNNDGLTLNTSKLSIQDAIDMVADNGTVTVKRGTYKEPLIIRKSVNLIGEDESNTIIEGTSEYKCLRIGTRIKVFISGFTIQKGTVGISTSSTSESIVRDTIIQNNEISGVSNYGVLTIYRSTIRNNDVGKNSGGGITNSGKLLVKNCLITHNTVDFFGGGIENNGDMEILNSEISHNNAFHGGGIYNYDGHLTIKNSVIKDNFAWEGGGIYNNYKAKVKLDKDVVIEGNWIFNRHRC